MPDKVVLSFQQVLERYLTGDVHESSEAVLGAVYEAMQPYFESPATPENMWIVQKQVLPPVINVARAKSVGPWFEVLAGSLAGGAVVLEAKNKDKVVGLWKTRHYFLKQNNITSKEALDAYERGNATIGELFFLQPSIFVD